MRTLIFEPLVPLGLWVGLSLIALVALLVYASTLRRRLAPARRALVTLLMALAVALPLAILLNPRWIERLPPPAGKPVLTLLVDDSASMATPDAADGQTRFAEAQRLARRIAHELADRYQIEADWFDTRVVPLSVGSAGDALEARQPKGQRTDLAAALDAALAADHPQGQAVLLLSDGAHNVGSQAGVLERARRAKAMATPIFTKTLGGQSQAKDLAIEIRSPQELAFVGQQIPLRAIVEPRGLAGHEATVVLSEGDHKIERRTLRIAGDEPLDVEFSVGHAESGIYHYELAVDPLVGEVTAANNRATFLLRVIDAPIRVLLLEGKPYWDTKFLLRTLAADPSLELTSVVRLASDRLLERQLARPPKRDVAPRPPTGAANAPPPAEAPSAEVQSADVPPGATQPPGSDPQQPPPAQAVPAAEGRTESWQILSSAEEVLASGDKLDEYQVVVLGRDAEIYLNDAALDRLKRWIVRDGGSLVCFRGAPMASVGQRLAQILPVRWETARESRFRMHWTADGRALGWLGTVADDTDRLSELPMLATRGQAGHLRPLATVLAVAEKPSADASPAVSMLPLGTGRVVTVEGAGMWRWAFLPPEYRVHEQVYGALWHSLTRWLVSSAGLLPNQTWSLRSDKVRFDVGEDVMLSLLVRASALARGVPRVELIGPDDARTTLTPLAEGDEPGSLRIRCGPLEAGRYAAAIVGSPADDAAAHTVFDVRENVSEVTRLDANGPLLLRVAELSGGRALESAGPAELAAEFSQHLARSHPEQVRSESAWDRPWVLLGVLFAWGLSWAVRRHSGLV